MKKLLLIMCAVLGMAIGAQAQKAQLQIGSAATLRWTVRTCTIMAP